VRYHSNRSQSICLEYKVCINEAAREMEEKGIASILVKDCRFGCKEMAVKISQKNSRKKSETSVQLEFQLFAAISCIGL
jgi:hypothetical protein